VGLKGGRGKSGKGKSFASVCLVTSPSLTEVREEKKKKEVCSDWSCREKKKGAQGPYILMLASVESGERRRSTILVHHQPYSGCGKGRKEKT